MYGLSDSTHASPIGEAHGEDHPNPQNDPQRIPVDEVSKEKDWEPSFFFDTRQSRGSPTVAHSSWYDEIIEAALPVESTSCQGLHQLQTESLVEELKQKAFFETGSKAPLQRDDTLTLSSQAQRRRGRGKRKPARRSSRIQLGTDVERTSGLRRSERLEEKTNQRNRTKRG